jgi:ATP-dependent protease HslVU (ClpYQ) peptidase subunit
MKHGISCIISGDKQVTDGETQAKQQTSEERL